MYKLLCLPVIKKPERHQVRKRTVFKVPEERLFKDTLHMEHPPNYAICWTGELEDRFLATVALLGVENYPSAILYHMNTTGITNKQVSAHLNTVRRKQELKNSVQDTHHVVTEKHKIQKTVPRPQMKEKCIEQNIDSIICFATDMLSTSCGPVDSFSSRTCFVPAFSSNTFSL